MNAHARPIIIRRKKVVHAHHGGSWKIALADFMTALMALFLVMWILTAASKQQREAVAEYFRTPLVVALAGGDKSTASTSAIPGGGDDPTHAEGEVRRIDRREYSRPSDAQRRFFEALQLRIEAAIMADPELRDLRGQMRFDMTLEGLRIQVLDTEQRPMFSLGSDRVEPYMRELLRTMAPLINELPNEMSISGHTDNLPYAGGIGGYSNWELSSARANASRRELVAGGLSPEKLLRVAGMADNVPMPEMPRESPMNRRIELLMLYPETANSIRSPAVLPEPAAEPVWIPGIEDLTAMLQSQAPAPAEQPERVL
ncbi:flagellar motor protein MotB [Mangrovimicrobium sediminis]|uniref:Flagellar motor protein MotB n=1 Tax=Mangrovimicrobium sediminis TaxID=2562682 RepID=A0A4Z0M149_9GAMM|nr:flagellar motor protein MotB [Haliea sp. SAOS-164]TGD73166.1 flagellar motor protein MotB [Haliea sp. SAOS-164]